MVTSGVTVPGVTPQRKITSQNDVLFIGLADRTYTRPVEIISKLVNLLTIETRAKYLVILLDDIKIDNDLVKSLKVNEIVCLDKLHDNQMANYIQ